MKSINKFGIISGTAGLLLAGAIGYYSSQRDNKTVSETVWYSQCFTESCYIALQINGVEKNPNELTELGDTTMLEIVQKMYGKKYQFFWFAYESALRYYLNGNKKNGDAEKYVKFFDCISFEEIKSEIERGYSVIASTFLPRKEEDNLVPNEHSGHIFVIIGYDRDGFYVNDPYGDLNTKYENTDGAGVFIDYDTASRFFKPGQSEKMENKRSCVRAIFVHADFENEID